MGSCCTPSKEAQTCELCQLQEQLRSAETQLFYMRRIRALRYKLYGVYVHYQPPRIGVTQIRDPDSTFHHQPAGNTWRQFRGIRPRIHLRRQQLEQSDIFDAQPDKK